MIIDEPPDELRDAIPIPRSSFHSIHFLTFLFSTLSLFRFPRIENLSDYSKISTQQLWSLIPLEKRDQYLADKDGDTAPVLDLLPLGYSKVLGKGRLPEIPIVVRARFFSREAERKIKEAGGVVELVA